jgi:hypothetical protein
MGFSVERVVSAFESVGIGLMDGKDYELEEAYLGNILDDITTKLFENA